MTTKARPFLLEWEDVVLRARLPSSTKLVALALKHHANKDGTNVRPGTALLAVKCDLSYVTVRRARQQLIAGGLLELVRRGNRRRGHTDEYRLILAEDLDEKLTWYSPSEVTAAAQKITETRQAAEAARIRQSKQDQDSPDDPESRDQDSPDDPESAIRAHRRPESGLTDDPPPSQGDQANEADHARLGSTTHYDNWGCCTEPACQMLIDPDGTCPKGHRQEVSHA